MEDGRGGRRYQYQTVGYNEGEEVVVSRQGGRTNGRMKGVGASG
jgi:hypothetical protein